MDIFQRSSDGLLVEVEKRNEFYVLLIFTRLACLICNFIKMVATVMFFKKSPLPNYSRRRRRHHHHHHHRCHRHLRYIKTRVSLVVT